MLKITDELMAQFLDEYEIEYECPVFCSYCKTDSFLSTGKNYLPAFAAISKFRTLLIAPITMSVYTDGSFDVMEYPMLRFDRCDISKTLFGNYRIKAIYTNEQKSVIIKINILRNVPFSDLQDQKNNIDRFADLCKEWGNSGLFNNTSKREK